MSLVHNAYKLKGLDNNNAAYYVVGYSRIQRQRQSKKLVARLRSFEETNHKPELILTYDGIPMVWVYSAENLSPTTKIIKQGGMMYSVLMWVWSIAMFFCIVPFKQSSPAPVLNKRGCSVKSNYQKE